VLSLSAGFSRKVMLNFCFILYTPPQNMPPPAELRKYTAIWQASNPHEREWIDEVMGPFIREHVTDGKHELVLDNAILLDAFVHCIDPSYYAGFRGMNAFLVHFLDENYEGSYEIYQNFRGVLRCHWSDVFSEQYLLRMPLGYSNGWGRNGRPIRKATERKYVWSFIGQAGKASRPDVANMLARIEPHFMFATDNVPGLALMSAVQGKPRRIPPSEASEILLDSMFSPAPMGNVNLETFRVYESLEAGSIPIVEKRLTLDYFRRLLGDHPMPAVRSWSEAARLVQKLLRNPDDIDQLQGDCLRWWDEYKVRFTEQFGKFLAERSANLAEAPGPMVSSLQKLPGWNVIELLRHHDTRALVRRVQRQADRLLRQGKLRVAPRRGARSGS
jgi:hypothetical protein